MSSNSEKIVQEYLEMENKTIENVELLANKHNITTKELISFFRQYNIETPKMFNRMEAMDWNENEDNISNEVDLDNDISVAVSIQKYFHDLGFDKKKGSERVKVLCHYIKTRYGIEPFSLFRIILENLIKDNGVFTLEKVLEAIKHRDSNISETTTDNKRNSIMNQIYSKMLNMTRDIMFESENERKERIIEGFRIINNTFEKEHRRKVKEGFKVINNVLGSVE